MLGSTFVLEKNESNYNIINIGQNRKFEGYMYSVVKKNNETYLVLNYDCSIWLAMSYKGGSTDKNKYEL